MKWLHLSDLHFDPENAGLGTTMLRKKLPAYLKDSGIKADHLFFTGDFRHASRQEDTDKVAKDAADFLLHIAESAGITDSRRIHIVPGNHDLTRVGYEKAKPDETDEEKKKREKAKEEGKKQVEAIRQAYESADGLFGKDGLDHLLGRFGFFCRMVKFLRLADVWKDSLLPLHPYRCLDDFSIVYMNTAVTCQKGEEDRGNLVVGRTDLYNCLDATKEKNPEKPVIVLAHHSPHYFSNNELQKIETVFKNFPDVALYLCGDEHKPWSRAVNTLPQFTAGCLTQDKETEVVFYTGELRNGKFLPPQAHRWDKNYSRWDVYPHANEHILEMITGARNPFFSVPQINIASNLDTLGIRLAEPFIGREKELENIRNTFQSDDTVFLTQSIKGLGGVGKTQIALKYAFSHKNTYEYVWWIDATAEIAIVDGYRAFLEKIGVAMDPKASPENCAHTVRAWMRENDNWLFVFDNADAYAREEKPVSPNKVLADYLPQGLDGKRHILITSRYGNWQGKTQDIDVFTPQEARDFLTRYAKLENDSFQDELVEKLGYLPLALEQAAAFICATKGSYERYLELFSRYSVEMLQRHPGEDDPKRIVYTTWNISRDQIKRQSALQLLDLLSFFASDNIDLQWFRKGVVHLPEPLQTDIQNELECEEILADLLRYFLITRQNEHLSLHRLVQEVIRGSLETEKRNEAADCCLHICGKCVFLDFSTVESRRRYSELQPHILSVLNASGDHLAELRANLYTFLGKGADEQGNYDKALEGFQKALAIREKVLRPDHPDTATSYNNVAMMYEKMGEYGKALEGCEKALAIRKKTPGPDHLDTATFYNNVAGVYYRKGEYDRALGEFEKALAIQEKLLGQNHPHTAQTYHNIALVYASKGEYDKALEGFQKTLAINEKVLGPEHPSTATIYNSIAGAYDHKGEYEKALEGFQKALAIREKVLGPDHPDTATTYNGIARVYDHKGEYDKALEGYKKTLAIREKLLGPDHPDTATSHNHIAGVYDSKGEYDKALRMYEKVLAIDEKVLGPDHPDTAASYNNIAFVYSHKAEYDEALRWYVCAFRVLPARLGDHHPTTRTVFENMFETYEKSGKTEDFQDWLDGKLTESDRCNEKR